MPFGNRLNIVINQYLLGNLGSANGFGDCETITILKIQIDIDAPLDKAERLLKSGHLVGWNLRPVRVPNVQLPDLCNRELIYRAVAVCHPIDAPIVHQHVMTIGGAAHVDFGVIRACVNGVL